MPTKIKAKKQRPSGVTVTMTKSGGFRMRTFGPNAPDLRTVIPELLGTNTTPKSTKRAAPPSDAHAVPSDDAHNAHNAPTSDEHVATTSDEHVATTSAEHVATTSAERRARSAPGRKRP